MSSIELKQIIEKTLTERFIKNPDEEWINVYIDAKNYIDIKMVSDQIRRPKQVRGILNDVISNNKYYGYNVGMILLYSTDEAVENEITNNQRKTRPSSLVEAIEFVKNSDLIEYEQQFKSKVISFYSYKGGVGRTLSLIHTAYLLAQKGKNVLMIDLDIEAPSMQNIFKEEMKDIDYGIIDYIYNKSFEKGLEKDISPSEIYVKIESENDKKISGNLYAIPAGKLNLEYIYKLSNIQPSLVSKNNYIYELIKTLEAKNELNLDFVLLDSRTGINEWGGLSLIDIADKAVFFIYPNEENLEGTKALINLVEGTKNGSSSVIFSRVDIKAHDKAKEFFDELSKDFQLNQKYIEVTYDADIAISREYPIYKMLERCESIKNLLLEEDIVSMSKTVLEKLSYDDRKSILFKLKDEFRSLNVIQYDSASSYKINEDNIYLIQSKDKELLSRYAKLFYRNSLNKKSNLWKESNCILDEDMFSGLKSYVGVKSWTDIWDAYILTLVNGYDGTCLMDELDEENIAKNMKYLEGKNILNIYKEIINTYWKLQKEDSERTISRIFGRNKLTILIDDCSWLNNLNSREFFRCLNDLKFKKAFFENNNININIKLFKQDTGNIDNVIMKQFKSNILNLEWNKNDIEHFITGVVCEAFNNLSAEPIKELIEEVLYNEFYDLNKIISNLFWGKEIIKNNKIISNEEVEKNDEFFDLDSIVYNWNDYDYDYDYDFDENYDFLEDFDVAEDENINTLDYFCENLEKLDKLNIIDAIDILLYAINIELGKKISNQDKQIISQDSLKQAFNNI